MNSLTATAAGAATADVDLLQFRHPMGLMTRIAQGDDDLIGSHAGSHPDLSGQRVEIDPGIGIMGAQRGDEGGGVFG